MSKLSFRARALDASKALSIFECSEIPDLPDFAAINRAVPQMPTGMEKEEESEHHLQRALSAQQVYGTSEALVIPTPEITQDDRNHGKLYAKDFKPPKQYIHVQAFSTDHEIPDYDMDSEDESWLQKQARKMEVTAQQFEEMMDRLEKGSGQTVVTLPEAKMLLKDDDDLIIAVYDYWLNKRLRTQHPLIAAVKTEKRDGSTTNNPYVAFRRRTEKMQTRKNRKNDEFSYEKMLKLRRDLSKAVTQLEMIKRREKTKKELLQLTIEIVEKRFQVGDFSGDRLAEALAQKHKLPTYIPLSQFALGHDWANLARKDEPGVPRKKREYKKRKHRQPVASRPAVHVPQYSEVDLMGTDVYSSDDDPLSAVMSPSAALSPSDAEEEADPDGNYAFRRMQGCTYQSPVDCLTDKWPWTRCALSKARFKYSLTALKEPRRCVGYARRRYGRGGRIIIDRAFSNLDELGVSSDEDLHQCVKMNRIPVYRPTTPPAVFGMDSELPPLSMVPEDLSFDSSFQDEEMCEESEGEEYFAQSLTLDSAELAASALLSVQPAPQSPPHVLVES